MAEKNGCVSSGASNAGGVGRNRDCEPKSVLTASVNAAAGNSTTTATCSKPCRALFSTSRHEHRLYLYYNNYIGCQLKLEYHTNCVLLCIESPTELRHYISSNSVNLAQTRVYVLRHATTIMSPALTGVLLIVPLLSLPPTVWNRLPSHIRSSPTFSSFLTRLKTHLSNTSFSPLQHVT